MQKEIALPLPDAFYEKIKRIDDFLSYFFVSILDTKKSAGFLSIVTCDKYDGHGLNIDTRKDYIYRLSEQDVCKFYGKVATEVICDYCYERLDLGGNDKNIWISLVSLSFPKSFLDDFIEYCKYNDFLNPIQKYLNHIGIKDYCAINKDSFSNINLFVLSPCFKLNQVFGGDSHDQVMHSFTVEHYSCCIACDFVTSWRRLQKLFNFFKENGQLKLFNNVDTEPG